jgi:hypothetical protein
MGGVIKAMVSALDYFQSLQTLSFLIQVVSILHRDIFISAAVYD